MIENKKGKKRTPYGPNRVPCIPLILPKPCILEGLLSYPSPSHLKREKKILQEPGKKTWRNRARRK